MPQVKLSVLIIAYNEEENIRACIESIGNLACELVVMDSFSTDRTVRIASSMGARVVQRQFDNYVAQRNAALQLLQHDWVFVIDADERLTLPLHEEILALLQSEPSQDAYRIRRETYFSGRKVRCWSRGWVTRLFRKSKGTYSADKLVHEDFMVAGTVGRLKHPLQHFTFRSFAQYMPKLYSFSALSAREAFHQGKRSSWLALFFLPPAKFIKTYFLRAGILDGIPGLLIACLSAYSAYLKQAILWELQQSKGEQA